MLRENPNILKALPDMLGCTIEVLCERSAVPVRTWKLWLTENIDPKKPNFNPKITKFVDICNRLHLGPHKFIQADTDMQHTPDAREVFPPGHTWKNVKFDQRMFLSYFGERGPIGMPMKEMMAKLNKTDETFRKGWKKPNDACTVRLYDLFLFCDLFNIDINKFLIDPNGRIYSEAICDIQDETIKKMRQYQGRIRELNKKVKEMEEELVEERKARMLAENRVGKLIEELGANNWNFVSEKAAEEGMV